MSEHETPATLFGNCFDLLATLPQGSVDMVMTDPPYGITQNKWDKLFSLETMWLELNRVCKPNAAMVFTAAQPFSSRMVMSNLEHFRYDLIWGKNKSTGWLNAKKMPLRQHEHVLVFYKKPPTYNPQKTQGHKAVNKFVTHTSDGTNYGKTRLGRSGGGQTDRYPSSIITLPVVNQDSKERIHPNQKPVELFDYLISTYSNEGDLILDPFAGSGTTGIAARTLSRRAILMEMDPDYFKSMEQRLR